MNAIPGKVQTLEELADRQLARDLQVVGRTLDGRKHSRNEAPALIELKAASDIPCVPIRWLWPGFLARGKYHLLAGSPGTGKTTISMSLAATVSSGSHWPSGSMAPPGSVLVWSGEDDPGDTLIPRLRAAGANLSRVHFIGDARVGEDVRSFDPAIDIPALEFEAKRLPNVALIIVDPVVTAVSGDSHKNTEVRRGLQPLVNLADRLGAAVLGISHFSKGTSGNDPVERVTGSIAFGALARVVMVAAKRVSGEEGPERLFARAKSNIGADGGGFEYGLEQVRIDDGLFASRVRWGDILEGTARELLGDIEEFDASPRNDAGEWLKAELSRGEVKVAVLKKEAAGAGMSWRTVENAKRDLGVVAERISEGNTGGGFWVWRIPDPGKAANGKAARLTTESCGLAELPAVTRVSGVPKAARPHNLESHGVADLPLRSVTCGGCQHFERNRLNASAGMGTCTANREPRRNEPLTYPDSPRYCESFECAPETAA